MNKEENLTRRAAFDLSRSARTAPEHKAAAEALLALTDRSGVYVMTPVTLTMAQVHATLAMGMVTS